MRAGLDGLETPSPIIGLLPGIYQEDHFTERFTAGFDAVLAPVLSTLDCLDAYVDPALAPDDFLPWLAGWVGVVLAEDWPVERQRALLRAIVPLYRMRGTAEGLRAEVELYSGGHVEIEETGAAGWSPSPGGAPPGTPGFRVTVRVQVADPSVVSRTGLEAVVAAALPAHVVATVHVVAAATSDDAMPHPEEAW